MNTIVVRLTLRALTILSVIFSLSVRVETGTVPILLGGTEHALNDSVYLHVKTLIANAYRTMNIEELTQAGQFVVSRLSGQPTDPLLLYYAGLVEFHLGFIHYLRPETRQTSLPHFDKAIDFLGKSARIDSASAEAYLLLGAVYGFKIGLSPENAPSLGLHSDRSLAKARQLDSTNPRLALVEGISALYKPAALGGGKDAALERFHTALRFFRNDRASIPTLPDWGLDDAYAWIVRVHLSSDQLEEAERFIREALTVNPENTYVRTVLLPRLEARRKPRDH